MKKKTENKKKAVILSILFALIIMLLSCQLAGQADTGTVWMKLADPISPASNTFVVEVYCNSGSQNVAAYGIDIAFDSSYINPKESVGQSGATTEGTSDGIMIAAAAINENKLTVSGFDVSGKGPGSDLNILNIHFTYNDFDTLDNEGTTLTLSVDSLADSNAQDLPNAQGSTLKIGQ